ncbi:oxaloacetate decarboxylase [Methanobacterium sp. SMA-27]|uniref:isocitrate lyase/PEP mutase family protein n=1 Tax=Methanobacterium sp. SMA-27 TaxID=1495336 RepID=UPI00064F941D|nr:isocitrate lyase/phosphoenolpyruvate mutase family protein [Methanobacterium sp. SMA-27]
MNESKELKKLLLSKETLVMPDAYDPVSAKLIERTGFKAVQCSGYSFSIAAARKKEMDISRLENIQITRSIVNAVDLPVMADAEDGYGDAAAVTETVNMFMDVGVAGLNIEDQLIDNDVGINIIEEDMMLEKIYAAREAVKTSNNPDFIINGRTDALKSTEDRHDALNIAIERANLYIKAGADIVFAAYVETLDEVETLENEVKGPISIAAGMPYNINNFSIEDLKNLGIARVSLPTLLIFSSLKSVELTLKILKNNDIMGIDDQLLYRAEDLNDLLKRN